MQDIPVARNLVMPMPDVFEHKVHRSGDRFRFKLDRERMAHIHDGHTFPCVEFPLQLIHRNLRRAELWQKPLAMIELDPEKDGQPKHKDYELGLGPDHAFPVLSMGRPPRNMRWRKTPTTGATSRQSAAKMANPAP